MITLRHKVKKHLDIALARHRAASLGKRMIFWKNTDSCSDKGGGQLSDEVGVLINELNDRVTKNIPQIGCFFPGIEYMFPENNLGNIHNREIKNHTCKGIKIVLHEREPYDDLSKPFRLLAYPPKAIFVKPDGPDIGDVCKGQAGCPRDCIPISQVCRTFPVSWTSHARLLFENTLELGNAVNVRRQGIPLSLAYCVTDYFAQGMSFKGLPWLIHLALPDSSPVFSKANILVPLSRPSLWSELKLLTPLWPDGDEEAKAKFITKVRNALKPNVDYKAEMDRAKELARGDKMKKLYKELMKVEMPAIED